jgi:hypothetical protein
MTRIVEIESRLLCDFETSDALAILPASAIRRRVTCCLKNWLQLDWCAALPFTAVRRFHEGEDFDGLRGRHYGVAALFVPPRATIDEIIAHTSDWIIRGGEAWNKPTQFEVRDGKF